MKKSELYTIALEVVVDSLWIDASERLEVIALLLSDRDIALYSERKEAEKAEQEKNA